MLNTRSAVAILRSELLKTHREHVFQISTLSKTHRNLDLVRACSEQHLQQDPRTPGMALQVPMRCDSDIVTQLRRCDAM